VRGPFRRARLWTVAVLATIVGAGCGVPQDGEPTVMPGGVVNPVLAPANTDSGPQSPGARQSDASVFLVEGEQLVRVPRSSRPSDLSGVMTLLLDGPTQSEFGAGLRSAISPRTTLRSARLDAADTAVVDLSGALVEVGGEEQILAVAQIVLTATAVAGVGQVRLLLEGQAVEVPRADGTLTSETLRAADYAGLRR
jgi:hypothetical protein